MANTKHWFFKARVRRLSDNLRKYDVERMRLAQIACNRRATSAAVGKNISSSWQGVGAYWRTGLDAEQDISSAASSRSCEYVATADARAPVQNRRLLQRECSW
jgi:hypothetical protein